MDNKIVQLEQNMPLEGMQAKIGELLAESKKNFFGSWQVNLILNCLGNLLCGMVAIVFVYLCSKRKLILQVLDWHEVVQVRYVRSNPPSKNCEEEVRDIDHDEEAPNGDELHDIQIISSACASPEIISTAIEEEVFQRMLTERSRGEVEWKKSKKRPEMLPVQSTSTPVPPAHGSSSAPATMPESPLRGSSASIKACATPYANCTDQLYSPDQRKALSPCNEVEVVMVIRMPGDHITMDMVEAEMASEIRCAPFRLTTLDAPLVDSGSWKVITARFMMTVGATNNIQELCEHVASKATKMDENATVQLGGVAILYYKAGEGIKTFELIKEAARHNVPIITSVTNFHGRALVVKGRYLTGTELKASTRNQSLRVFRQIKHKDGLEAIFARIPHEHFEEGTLVYANKTICIGRAQSVVVRSEGKPIQIPAPLRRPALILGELRATRAIHWILVIIFNMIEAASFLPTHSLIAALGLQFIIWILIYCFVVSTLGPWIMEILIRWVAVRWSQSMIDAHLQVKRAAQLTETNKSMNRSVWRRNDDHDDTDSDTSSEHPSISDPRLEHDGQQKILLTDSNWLWPCIERSFDKGRWHMKVARTQIKQTKEAPFEVITTISPNGSGPDLVCVKLHSPALAKIINQSNPECPADHEGVNEIDDKKIFLGREGLYKYVSSIAIDDETATTWSVKHLLRFMEGHFKDELLQYPRMKEQGCVSFDMLWTFLVPGVEVCHKCLITEQQCFGTVKSVSYKTDYRTGRKYFEVALNVMDYNVESYYQCHVDLEIDTFDGEFPLTSLKVCPMEFFGDDQQDTMKARFLEMGTQFYTVAMRDPFCLMQFKGSLNFWDENRGKPLLKKMNAEGRVMIDLLNFTRMNPGYPNQGNAKPPCHILTGIEAPKPLTKPGDEELMLSPAIVYGFSFSLKKWGCFEVCGLREMVFDEGTFEVLKIRSLDQKEMLRALVEQYLLTREGEPGSEVTEEPAVAAISNVDPISSKGKGCIVLCHGPPGTGKTMTAEALAETLHCPLWSIRAFELGTQPDELERRLSCVLELARTWRAILLLDEADAFLERRGNGMDVTRNLMTGVFLRMLEYYSGVLFLTTNRANSFDDAILSRMTISISYPALDDEQRVKIWETLLSRVGLDRVAVQPFLKHHLNGRQIRNVVRLAQVSASGLKQALAIEHVQKAMDSFIAGIDDLPA